MCSRWQELGAGVLPPNETSLIRITLDKASKSHCHIETDSSSCVRWERRVNSGKLCFAGISLGQNRGSHCIVSAQTEHADVCHWTNSEHIVVLFCKWAGKMRLWSRNRENMVSGRTAQQHMVLKMEESCFHGASQLNCGFFMSIKFQHVLRSNKSGWPWS